MLLWLREKWKSPTIRLVAYYFLLIAGIVIFPALFVGWWFCNRKTIPIWLGIAVSVVPLSIALFTYWFCEQISHRNWQIPLESIFSLIGTLLAVCFIIVRSVSASERSNRFYNLRAIVLYVCTSYILLSPVILLHILIDQYKANVTPFIPSLYVIESEILLWILMLIYLHFRYPSDSVVAQMNAVYQETRLQRKQLIAL